MQIVETFPMCTRPVAEEQKVPAATGVSDHVLVKGCGRRDGIGLAATHRASVYSMIAGTAFVWLSLELLAPGQVCRHQGPKDHTVFKAF